MNRNFIPVRNNEGLVRDPRSNAIISTDDNKYKQAKLRKEAQKRQMRLEQKVSLLEYENRNLRQMIDNLMNEMVDIKRKIGIE
jgi:Trm5-related predicted tRNA methylase